MSFKPHASLTCFLLLFHTTFIEILFLNCICLSIFVIFQRFFMCFQHNIPNKSTHIYFVNEQTIDFHIRSRHQVPAAIFIRKFLHIVSQVNKIVSKGVPNPKYILNPEISEIGNYSQISNTNTQPKTRLGGMFFFHAQTQTQTCFTSSRYSSKRPNME